MADDRTRKPTGLPSAPSGAKPFVPTPDNPLRDPRAGIVVPLRYRYQTFIEFVETQSVNVSKSGLFIATDEPKPIGTVLEFEFSLADGFAILSGKAEVVRISQTPSGMGVKFLELDAASRKLIARIVDVNTREGKRPTVAIEYADPTAIAELRGLAGATPITSAGVAFAGRDLRVQINPATVGYFVYNPLLNLRLGGFVVPAEEDVPLGTIYGVELTDLAGNVLFAGKGKVVAKHEKRLGIRLTDVDKVTLARLQAEVNKLAPNKPG